MSDSDPFGKGQQSVPFDPDAPIKKTSAAQQMADAFPPGWEENTDSNIQTDQPSSGVGSIADSAPKKRVLPSKPAAVRPKFQKPKAPMNGSNEDADIVIAVPKSKQPPPSNDSTSSHSVASSVVIAKPPPVRPSPPPVAASSEDNPFGTSSKSKAFDPDAPIAKTAAASMMSEFPEESAEKNPNEEEQLNQPPPAAKPKPVRKAVAKRVPNPAAAIEKPPQEEIAASAAAVPSSSSADASHDDVPPPATSVLSNTPPLKAIGASSSSVPSMDSEFPEENGEAETFSGPLESRLVHKNWKARAQAYEEMRGIIAGVSDEDDDARKEVAERFAPFLKKMVNDVSVPALEAGLQAAVLWVDKASYDHGAPAHAEELMTACLKKGYSGRPATKTAADQIALLLIECGAGEVVLQHLTTGTQNNVPKIASGCAALIVNALQSFGPGVIPFDKMQKALPKILAHTNGAVRKEATDLAVELWRWMGSIFTTYMKGLSLKSAQEKELEGLFEKTPTGQSRPTKFLRSEVKNGASASGPGKKGKGGAASSSDGAYDPMSFVKPVDICAKLSKGWTDKVINEKKWQDRKELLQELSNLAEATTKIEIGPNFVEVLGALKKCLKDSNVVLVGDALKCFLGLAKGTRKGFYNHARSLFPILIQLMKEKKSTVSVPLIQLLDSFAELAIIEIPDVLEPLQEGLADKVSKVRIDVAAYLQRWLEHPRVTEKVLKDSIKPLAEALYKGLNDAEAEVRNAATAAFAVLVATVGKKPVQDMLKKLESLEVKRFQKLEQLIAASKKNSVASSSTDAPAADDDSQSSSASSVPAKKSSAGAKKSLTGSASSSSLKDDSKEEKPTPAAAAASSVRPSSALGVAGKTKVKADGSSTARPGGLPKAARIEKPSAAPTPAAEAVVESDGAIRRIDLAAKTARLKKDAKRVKGNFREWGPDEVEEMKESLRALCSDDLHALLFGKDFSKHMQGIELLESQVESHYDALVSVSDLVLKYIAWRLCDANTSLLMKALSFTHKLFSAFQAHEYQLSEGEANNILPFLIEKVFGHGTDRFRIEARELIIIAQTIYTPKGVFAALIVGYESKNKRVFSECLSESASMIVKHGVGVCDAKKVLMLMAQTVGASDSIVRTAALGALGDVYKAIGEGIWNYLGGKGGANTKIPGKQMQMIEARFKTIKPNVTEDAPPAAAPVAHAEKPTVSTSSSQPPTKSGPGTPRRSTKMPSASPAASPGAHTASKSAHVSPRNSVAPTAAATARPSTARSLVMPTGRSTTSAPVTAEGGLPNCFSLDLDTSISLESGVSRTAPSSPGHRLEVARPTASSASTSPHGHVAAGAPLFQKAVVGKPQLVLPSKPTDPSVIEQLGHYMDSTYASHLSDEEKMDVMKQLLEMVIDRAALLANQSDEITAFLMKQVDRCFVERDGQLQVNHRLCRYALNTLLEMFKVEEVAVGVKNGTLDSLIRLLLLKLMDDRLKTHPDQACRSLTMAVNVLVLKVLENGDRTNIFLILLHCLQTGTGTGSMQDQVNKTFTDLVVRSLMKLSKNLANPAFREGLNLSKLLHTIHEFMVAHKPTIGLVGDDMQTKALKAILSNLATARENEIKADCVAAGLPAGSPALFYVEKMLNYNAKQRSAAGSTIASVAEPKASPAPVGSSVAISAPSGPVDVARRLNLDEEAENDAASSNRPAVGAAAVDASKIRASVAPVAAVQPAPAVVEAPIDPLQQSLIEIVARTIKPATTQSALKELYEFTLAHPSVDIWPAFKQQGDSFRAYVQRSLAREASTRGVAPPTAAAPVAATAPSGPPIAAPTTIRAASLAPTASPAASPAASPSTARTSGEAAVNALYRQRLSVLQERGKMATDPSGAQTTVATTAPPAASTTTSSSIEAIRARFKNAKATDENSGSASGTTNDATPASNVTVLAPSAVSQQPAAAVAPKPNSIDAIKARIAQMKSAANTTTI